MRYTWLGVLVVAWLGAVPAPAPAQSTRADVIAIDVLIEPDAALIENARAVNARLRQNYPEGYALDSAHAPHITLLQRFVRAQDLGRIAAAVRKVADTRDALPLKLSATGYVSAVWSGLGVLVYTTDRPPELLRLADDVVKAVQPFVISGGTADAFVRAPGETINPDTIRWVENFVPASSGEQFQPHVTIGTAHPDFVKTLVKAPFDKFGFHGVNIAIYRLGNFGTAQKKLWSWR